MACFSIAAAYHSAVGDDLEAIVFNQEGMREHLLECLELKKLSLFPTACGLTTRCAKKHLFVHVYCVCNLPESYDSKMIACDKCGTWFHFKCMGLKKTRMPVTWFCSNCM